LEATRKIRKAAALKIDEPGALVNFFTRGAALV
jgi:hypothetical protein